MSWFGYVWIVVLVIAYAIWTIKSIIDFISDVKGIWKLSFLFSNCDRSWVWWIGIHAIVILAGSLAYFFIDDRWLIISIFKAIIDEIFD